MAAAGAPAKKVAVVLAGCGVFDGTECTEGVSVLIHLSANGAQATCFAPDKPQAHVLDHTTGNEIDVPRNVLVESARIARGKITALSQIDVSEFSALIIPGGFGAAKNLCNHATEAQGDASKMVVDPDVEAAIKAFRAADKPLGFCCISPVIAAHVLKCTVTVGQAEGDKWPYAGTVGAIQNYGGTHEAKQLDEVCIDAANKVATSVGYMYDGEPHEIYESVGLMVKAVLDMA